MSAVRPEIIKCSKCGQETAKKQIALIHTERDFAVPIKCIHRPLHSEAEASAMQAACPEVEIRIDANEDGTEKAFIPILSNQRAKSQMYKYLKLQESK